MNFIPRSAAPVRIVKPVRVRTGFTLVELLVALAVMGVLMALVFSAVHIMRENSWESKCASNMRQITQAILLYANEHNGMGPSGNNVKQYEAAGGVPNKTGLASTYFYNIWPYFYGSWATHRSPNNVVTMDSMTQNVFHCPTRYVRYPSAELAPAKMFVSGTTSSFSWWDNYAYAINAMAASGPDLVQDERAKKPVRIWGMRSMSRTVALVEDYNWYASFDKYYNRYGVLPHRGRANFAFYDGHIESLNRSQIPTKAQAPSSTFWAGDYAE